MLLMRIVQRAGSRARDCADPGSDRSPGQRTDPCSASCANAYAPGCVHMALVANVSSVRIMIRMVIRTILSCGGKI